ncbi:MAG: MFS transporter [Bacteroidota bacterium]
MPKKKDGFDRRGVLNISISHFIHDIYTAFLAPALPILIEKIGMSYGLAGLLSVIQRIPSLFNPLIGMIAEKPFMRTLIILSPSITAVSMSLIGVAPGYVFLAILLFVSGLSSTFWHIPTPVMIKQLSGSRTGKGMSYYMVGGELARTVGPLLIMGVISLWGIEGSWKMIPFGLFASLNLFLNFRKISIKTAPAVQASPEGNYRAIFKRYFPAFMLTGGFTLFQSGMKGALTFYLPTFLTSEGYTIQFADLALTLLQLAGAAGALASGSLSDFLGRKRTLLIISISSPLLMLLFLNLSSFWIFAVLVPLGFFLFAPVSVMMAVVQDLNTEKKAFVNAIYMTINFFINALITPLVGVISDHYGFYTSYYLFAFVAFGAAGIVIFTGKKLNPLTGN